MGRWETGTTARDGITRNPGRRRCIAPVSPDKIGCGGPREGARDFVRHRTIVHGAERLSGAAPLSAAPPAVIVVTATLASRWVRGDCGPWRLSPRVAVRLQGKSRAWPLALGHIDRCRLGTDARYPDVHRVGWPPTLLYAPGCERKRQRDRGVPTSSARASQRCGSSARGPCSGQEWRATR